MTKKRKKPPREPGSDITRQEYADMVIAIHSAYKCDRDAVVDHLTLDFYFPELQLAIMYDEMSQNDEKYLEAKYQIFTRVMTPYEIAEEDVELEWNKNEDV